MLAQRGGVELSADRKAQLLSRRELVDAGDQRDHANSHVEGLGDLPHVGRLRHFYDHVPHRSSTASDWGSGAS